MDDTHAVAMLGALAQPVRLELLRLLAASGPRGLGAGVLAERLALAPSALSFHLKTLARARLVSVEQAGRCRVYRAHPELLRALFAHLLASGLQA